MIFSSHGNKFWSNKNIQGLTIIFCFLVTIPKMIYSIYDSNREHVWIKNELVIKDGFTIGLKQLSDSTYYKKMLNTLDTINSLEKFQLVPVSIFVKIIESTPDKQFFKIKWTIKRNRKLLDLDYQCWISQLLIEKSEK